MARKKNDLGFELATDTGWGPFIFVGLLFVPFLVRVVIPALFEVQSTQQPFAGDE